ncbi:hypothetical protein WL57_02220 [Burkholderia cepacia]|nr:hypothetical protein WL57_02220 [Burkholderia cepacia]
MVCPADTRAAAMSELTPRASSAFSVGFRLTLMTFQFMFFDQTEMYHGARLRIATLWEAIV